MLLILLCGLVFFLKLYFGISWLLSIILTIVVGIVYIILDGVLVIGKYIGLFILAIVIVYWFIHMIGG